MTDTVIVGILSLAGTLMGAFGGVFTGAKMTNYRIEQLEKKVEKHNSFAERIPVIEARIKADEHRIGDLEQLI